MKWRQTILKMVTVSISVFLLCANLSFAQDTTSVVVSIPPLKTFVKKIGEDKVQVTVMVKPGDDPHTYEPKPKQMTILSEARAYFAIGVDFESVWLDRFQSSNPGMKIVHTGAGVRKLPMKTVLHHENNHVEDHQDHHHHKHDPGNPDPHVWLSPPNVIIILRNIVQGLTMLEPENAKFYQSNYKRFCKEVIDLDIRLMGIFADKKENEFMVFHPAWGYFADAYKLKQIPVEIEGKEPKPKELKKLIEHAKMKNIGVIFVQPQFSSRSAEMVAKAINAEVVFIDPLSENWLKNMKHVARQFEKALKK